MDELFDTIKNKIETSDSGIVFILKDEYDKVFSTPFERNIISMTLAYYPIPATSKLNNNGIKRSGVLLTGDYCLKRGTVFFEKFDERYKDIYDKIGVFQVPHHGSIKDWNNQIIKKLKPDTESKPETELESDIVYVFCFGLDWYKRYSHPSTEILNRLCAEGIDYALVERGKGFCKYCWEST